MEAKAEKNTMLTIMLITVKPTPTNKHFIAFPGSSRLNAKYAIIEVPGRSKGPVVQDVNTQSMTNETASVSVTMAPLFRNPSQTQVGQSIGNRLGITDTLFLEI